MGALLFQIFFLIWTVMLGILALPTLLLPWGFVKWLPKFWIGGIFFLARIFCGIRYRVEGKIPKGPCVIASEHQSAWETFFYYYHFDAPTIILKRELLWIPIFGWYLAKMPVIAIHRGRKTQALKQILTQAKKLLEKDPARVFVIFPQGTRTLRGEAFKIQSGFFALAKELQLPIIPVTLNSGEIWGKKTWRKKRGEIVVKFHPTIAMKNKRAVLSALSNYFR